MISLLGPTAVGKSKLAVEISQRINGEIISADSMQVYRGMDIGTAKLSFEERQGIPHHLIDIREPDENWTVSDFVEQTNKLTNEITRRGRIPIIVGGTGLYLWSLFEGFSFPIAAADKEVRRRLEKESLPNLHNRLKSIDPQAAQKIHSNDKKRIIRALEVHELTGEPITKLQKRGFNPPYLSGGDYDAILIGINLSRPKLYEQIDQRADSMIEKGLIEEVKGLLAKGYSKDLPSFQALGYKEAVEYVEGKRPKEKMIEELKKRTKNFARRQMTWFKRFRNVKWFEQPVDTRTILDYINNV